MFRAGAVAIWIKDDMHSVVDRWGHGIWARGQNRAGLHRVATRIFQLCCLAVSTPTLLHARESVWPGNHRWWRALFVAETGTVYQPGNTLNKLHARCCDSQGNKPLNVVVPEMLRTTAAFAPG